MFDVDAPVIALAASARPLVASLRQAGAESVIAVDFFGDADTRTMASETHVVTPSAIADALAAMPAAWPLVYGGAMENRPALLDAIACTRRVIGPTGEPLRRVRSLDDIDAVTRPVGWPVPQRRSSRPSSSDWLWKPLASGSGLGIGPHEQSRPGYWQRRIDGVARGLHFGWVEGCCRLLSRVRHEPVDRSPSVGPFVAMDLIGESLPSDIAPTEQLGRTIAEAFGLRGPFGVDVIDAADGRSFLLEVNPRFTAGMGLLERVTDQSVFTSPTPADLTGVARRVVFAPQVLSVPPLTGPDIADIPAVTDRPAIVPAGQPLCTVYGRDQPELIEHEQRVLALVTKHVP